MPSGASEPSPSCYLALIKTTEGEHTGYLTQTAYCTKLLLLGEARATPALSICLCLGGFEMHIHERCRLGGESGGVLEANLHPVGRGEEDGENGAEGRRRT